MPTTDQPCKEHFGKEHPGKDNPGKDDAAGETRADRLAAALRDNLKKRKARARGEAVQEAARDSHRDDPAGDWDRPAR